MEQYSYLAFEDQRALEIWHLWLDDNRGDRARLRRAECPTDILLTDAFFHFLEKMPNSEQWRKNMITSACVAGALSNVKQNEPPPSQIYKTKMASFAEQLATPIKGKSKAPMSELRFQKLQKSKTNEDFFRLILQPSTDYLDLFYPQHYLSFNS